MELMKVTLQFFLFVTFVKNSVLSKKFDYKFEFAVFVTEMKNHTNHSNHTVNSEADVHICKLENEEILNICREATEDSYLKTAKVEFVEGSPPGKEKVYGFLFSSWQYQGKPTVIETVCSCPTNPLLYLKDRSSGTAVEAYVSLREAYND